MPGLTTVISPIVVSLAHLVLAVGVTVHVLLHKRDAGSNIAWIGLAWLAPILGSVLYLLFGINRVQRRAQSLRERRSVLRVAETSRGLGRDDHLAPLECAGDRITQRPAEGGNAIAILHNGDEAYPRMIAVIDAARQFSVHRARAVTVVFKRAVTPSRDNDIDSSSAASRSSWRRNLGLSCTMVTCEPKGQNVRSPPRPFLPDRLSSVERLDCRTRFCSG